MNERQLEMAEQFQEDQLARSIRAAALFEDLPAAGTCHNCDTLLDDGRKFCDPDCEQDWSLRRKLLKQAPYVPKGEF